MVDNDVDMIELASGSSNATADDLPGPGRLLGRFYHFCGKYVERAFNTLAEKNGLGPLAAAKRIRSRRHNRLVRDGYGDEYEKKQRNDCMKLIRYTKARVEMTRRQALEEIINLSVIDAHILELLVSLKAGELIQKQEDFIWSYCDTSLVLTSRTALACLQERKIFKLVMEYSKPGMTDDKALVDFVRLDPEDSYLALRLFRSVLLQRDIPCSRFEYVLENIGQMAAMIPNNIEWPELHKIMHTWMDRVTLGCYFTCSSTLLSRPQLLVNLSFDGAYPAIKEWLDRLRNPVDYTAHALLHWTVTQSKFEDWTHTEKAINDLYRSLRPFLNPCDLAVGQIASELNICPSAGFCEEHLKANCDVLLASIPSEDDMTRERAIICIKLVLSHDVHSRNAMYDAISHSETMEIFKDILHSSSNNYGSQFTVNMRGGLTAYRHLNARDELVHVPHWSESTSDCTEECEVEHELVYRYSGILMLRYNAGSVIKLPSSGSFNPIRVGTFPDGRIAYLASAYFTHTTAQPDCCVWEGVRPEELLVRDLTTGELMAPSAVGVAVLRYAPWEYSDGYVQELDVEAMDLDTDVEMDTTGPFAWRVCDD